MEDRRLFQLQELLRGMKPYQGTETTDDTPLMSAAELARIIAMAAFFLDLPVPLSCLRKTGLALLTEQNPEVLLDAEQILNRFATDGKH